jgi:hypothetical protein
VDYGVLVNDNHPVVANAALQAAKQRARTDLLAALPQPVPAGLAGTVDGALGWARDSLLDDEHRGAWSAVFIVACVRQAAIRLGIEGEADGGTHVGKDELLVATQRHSDFLVEAHRRRFDPAARGGAYHAFRIGERRVQVGDIIVQDRVESQNLQAVLLFDDIPDRARGRLLHADIIVEVADDHVVAIGGNLGQSVRRRRYPTTDGRLVIDWNQLYTQETDGLHLPGLPAPHNANTLHLESTWRIFALLSLVEQCGVIPGQRWHGGVLT